MECETAAAGTEAPEETGSPTVAVAQPPALARLGALADTLLAASPGGRGAGSTRLLTQRAAAAGDALAGQTSARALAPVAPGQTPEPASQPRGSLPAVPPLTAGEAPADPVPAAGEATGVTAPTGAGSLPPATELADLVDEVLREQAWRHGVDLS